MSLRFGDRCATDRLFGGRGNGNGELAACAGLAADIDTTAMCLHDPLNEAEAEARSLLDLHDAGADRSAQIWALLMLALWHREFA